MGGGRAMEAGSDRPRAQKVTDQAVVKLEVTLGFWSRCQYWKLQVCPGRTTPLLGQLLKSAWVARIPAPLMRAGLKRPIEPVRHRIPWEPPG